MDTNYFLQHTYLVNEAEKIKKIKQIMLHEFDNLRVDEEAMIHIYQADTAYKVVGKFTDKKIINQMVLGKTGCMLAIIQAYLSSDNMIPIKIFLS